MLRLYFHLDHMEVRGYSDVHVLLSRPGIWDLLSQPFAGRVDGLPDNSPSSPTRGPQGLSFDSLVHYFL